MNAPVDHTKLAQFNDSFVNWLAGLGVPGRDKGASQQFTFNPLSRMELEFAYRGDWIARKVIDIPADDATREWRSWQTSNKNIERIEEVENQLFIQRKVKKAMQLARLYGGAALVLGVGTDDAAEELVPDAVNKDDLKFIHAIPAHAITSGPLITDLTSEYYGEPEYYTTLGSITETAITSGKKIHPSRVIRFLGNELPDPNMMMGVSAQGWGDSVLQPIAEAIKAVGLVSAAGATLASEAKIDVIKMPGLSERIATQEYKDMLTQRFSYSNVAKSLINTLVLDGEEEWQRINAEFRDIPELIKVYLLMVSGACDIPATRMLGQSPQGLNATGESDLQNYYDNVGAEQKNTIQPTLARFDEVLIRSALGSRDASIYYDWRPLWQMSEDAASKVYLAKAQIFKIDADEGLIDAEALRVGRQNQLIEDGVYPGLEEALEAQEALGEASMLSPEEQAAEAEAEQAQQLQHQVKLAQATGKPKPITKDATPRTLYVYRPVLNWRDIARWAKSQGFATTLGSDMHVTVIYSKAQVDWMKVNDDSWSNSDDGTMHVAPGGPRMLEKFGDATVLVFANSRLAWRHGDIRRTTGASFDFDEYQPHITITYKVPSDLDVTKIAAYNGAIELGPECFEEINDNYKSEVAEDGVIPFDGYDPKRDNPTVHDYDPDQPRAPAGDPDGGQWVGENNGKSSTGTAAQRLQKQSGVRRSSVELETHGGSDLTTPLEGLPRNVTIPGVGKITAGPLPEARQAAYDYMKSAGLPYDPPTEYVKVDAERATRIANEYDKMKHDPNDPKVKASYDAMIKESIAQLKAVQATGLDIEFIDYEKQGNPYAASPRLATEDVKNNNHLWVFPTSAGFGSSKEFDASDNPLLQKAGVTIHGHELVANDVFRIVHDYFGHIKEGNGFRADGEENAWRSHSAMFSPLARQAMTTETRGQNSWVNYGPYGEQNRTAKSDTHFADQKVGLLPGWVAKEGSGQHK